METRRLAGTIGTSRLGDPACWDRDLNFNLCCIQNNPSCWDAIYTRERCCMVGFEESLDTYLAPSWLGDPACWSGLMDFETCCIQGLACWDSVFTPDRCCGEIAAVRLALARTELRDRKRFTALPSKLDILQPVAEILYRFGWRTRSIPIKRACLALLGIGTILKCSIGGTASRGDVSYKQNNHEAALLRTVATLGIMIGHLIDVVTRPTASTGILKCLSVVYADMFFVVSAYLVAARCTGKKDKRVSFRVEFLWTLVAILRRILRTGAVVLVAWLCDFDSDYSSTSVLLMRKWPLWQEFMCYVVVRIVAGCEKVYGEMASIALSTVAISWCAHQRAQPVFPMMPDGHIDLMNGKIWSYLHMSISLHRLPLSLFAYVTTRVVASCFHKSAAIQAAANEARLWSKLLSLLVLAAAALCVTLTGWLEWLCVAYGSTLPWWFYPLGAKLPLLVGCIGFLESSRYSYGIDIVMPSCALRYFSMLQDLSLGAIIAHGEVLRVLGSRWNEFEGVASAIPTLFLSSFLFGAFVFYISRPCCHLSLSLLDATSRVALEHHISACRWLASAVLLTVMLVYLIEAGT